jgi:BirA family biotin operon repressor/biotin-[acetyl-CoA-carboxylase] ligase
MEFNVINLDECDSTNNYIKSRYEEFKDSRPVWVTSALQTGGRGREKRTWISPKGKGLYTSFGFKLKTGDNLRLLPLIAGISGVETLEKVTGFPFGLKWPNDVLYDNKKVAGILIENIIAEDNVYCIAGFGLNLNHTPHDFPGELLNKAASLKMVTGSTEDYRVEDVNPRLAAVFFHWVEKMKTGAGKEIIDTARRYSAFLMNKSISFHQGADNRVVQGIFKGIDDTGGLVLEIEQGHSSIYYSGEIL